MTAATHFEFKIGSHDFIQMPLNHIPFRNQRKRHLERGPFYRHWTNTKRKL